MAVLDAESPDLDRFRIPTLAEIAHDTGVDRSRDRQRLEGRTQFVNLVRHPVEHVFLALLVDPVGVEFGQGCERKDFAGVDVEDDTGSAHCADRQHATAKFVFEGTLHAHVDRERYAVAAQRRVVQLLVQHLFHADTAVSVGGNIAEHVCAHRTLRIMAIGFARHFKREFADFLHPVRFFGKHAAADIARAARCEARGEFSLVERREDGNEFACDLLRRFYQRRAFIAQSLGIVPQRIGGKGAGQRLAVAVGNFAARRQQRVFERRA